MKTEVKKLDVTAYRVSLNGTDYLLLIEQEDQLVTFELLAAKYEVLECGSAENGPSLQRMLVDYELINYGMGGCSEENVVDFVENSTDDDEAAFRLEVEKSQDEAFWEQKTKGTNR